MSAERPTGSSPKPESRWVIAFATLIRAFAMSLGALALGWGVTLTEGLGASVLAACSGVILGEVFSRSKLKLNAILLGNLLAFLFSWGMSRVVTNNETIAGILGAGGALTVAVFMRFGAFIFAGTLALRVLATRQKTLVALELGVLASAVVGVFATHRDGVLVRPLWLSDWAWSVGLEPVQVLLGVGVGSVTLLAVLLIVQNRSGRALSALIALLALGSLAILTVNAKGLPAPTAENDLGLLTPPGEQPHHPPPSDGGGNGNSSGEDSSVGEGGQRPDGSEPGDAGGTPDGGAGDGSGSADGSRGDGGTQGPGGDASQDVTQDGGGSGQRPDGSSDGGGSSGQDAGDGGSSGGDGSMDVQSQMPMSLQDGGGSSQPMGDVPVSPQPSQSDGGGSGPPPPQPPSQDLENERNQQQQQQRAAPLAVMLLDDDYDPPSGAYYLRQIAWSEFNGTRLVPTTHLDLDRDIPQGYPTEPMTLPDRPAATGRTLVHHTIALLVEHNNPFGIEGAIRFAPARNPNPSRFQRAYKVESLAQTVPYRELFGRRVGNPAWTPEQRAYYLQAPTDPRYRRLADEIVGRIPLARRNDPFRRAVAIKLWLDDNLIYTTRARHADAADPTADMLWGNKRGYCVHFAHAAVFLWRLLGIPARIGSGYHVDAQNRGSSSTVIIKSSDGHAWPELYVQGLGWMVLDIGAKRNEDPQGQAQDEDERDRLGQMAREQPPDPQDPPRPQQQPQRPNRAAQAAKAAAKAFPWLMLAVLLALYGVKLWRRLVPSFVKGKAHPRVALRAALDVLAEAGITREFGETREAFSRRIKQGAPSFALLSGEAERMKFGAVAESAPEPKELREALSQVRTDVRKMKPWWRRLLGLIHPTSWMDSN